MFWQRRNATRASQACKVGHQGLEQLDARVVPSTIQVAPGTHSAAIAAISHQSSSYHYYFDEYGNHSKDILSYDGSKHAYELKSWSFGTKNEWYVNVYEYHGSSKLSDVLYFYKDKDQSGEYHYWLSVYSDYESGDEGNPSADTGLPDPESYHANYSTYEDDFGNVYYHHGQDNYYFYGDSEYYPESDE